MEDRSTSVIKSLPLNTRESEHRSRKRLGFHVFLSRYLQEFRKLGIGEQKEAVRRVNRGRNGVGGRRRPEGGGVMDSDNNDDESSLDSTNSEFTRKVPHLEAMRVACHNWSHVSSAEIKEAWKQRAEMLNRLPLPGKFVHVPSEIGSAEGAENEFVKIILESLTIEWDNTYKIMKRCITKSPKASISKTVCNFGHEKVELNSQTLRTLYIPYLLQRCMFGKDFCKLRKYELIRKTNRQVLIHIASQRRMRDLFTLEDRCAVEFKVRVEGICVYKKTCGGKVNILIDNKNIIGYIVDESNGRWKIQLASNRTIWLNMVRLNADMPGYYEYNTWKATRITTYWPIRLLVYTNGNCKLTLNRIGFDSISDNILPHHSS